MHGVLLVNPSSGDGESDGDDLAAHFPTSEVVECAPGEMAERAEAALRGAAGYLAVAGGDGTLRCVADVLAGSDVALVPVPAGTRNHFAGELGIDNVEDAARAVSGEVRSVDLGEVNGRRFLNNSSIGVYPRIVLTREAHERRWPKRLANLVAVWEQLRHGHRFQVEVDGRWYRAWMVFVGNGCYGEGPLNLAGREALDQNVLDVRVVRADAPLARTRVAAALLLGRLERSPLLVCIRCAEIDLQLEGDAVDVALDGEVEELSAPLRYRSLAGALRVLVPTEAASPEGRNTLER